MGWQALIAVGGTLLGIVVGAVINHLSAVSAQEREHSFRRAVQEDERAAEAVAQDRAELRTLRLQRLKPVIDLLDRCEQQLLFHTTGQTVRTVETSAKLQEFVDANSGDLSPDRRADLTKRVRDRIRELIQGEVHGWTPADAANAMATTYRLDDDALVVELQVIVGLLATRETGIDFKVMADRIRAVRARVERHAATVDD